jgi:hypothetical protein
MRTVIVACKIPSGLNLGDGVIIAGPKPILPGQSYDPRSRPGGFILNREVSADVWERWVKANADSAAIQGGLVFGHENYGVVYNWCTAHAKSRSGFEQAPQGMKV